MAFYNPYDWEEDSGGNPLARAGAAWVTGGTSEIDNAIDLVGGEGSTDAAMDWAVDQGAAAFPGTVDEVDQNVDMSVQTPYVTEALDSAYDTSDSLYGTANSLENLGYDAQQQASQDASLAQSVAMNVGQEAHDTAQEGGQALQTLAAQTYGQSLQDQAQLENLGQYMGLAGENLGNFIQGQTSADAAGIDAMGQYVGAQGEGLGNFIQGQSEANAAALAAQGDIYASQMGGYADQASAAGTQYNPLLSGMASTSINTGLNAQQDLTQIGALSGQTGQQGAAALSGLAGQTQAAAVDMYGRPAATYTPEEQRAMLLNASGYADDLAMLEATRGPSAAQAQFNVLQNQAMQDNLALARSGSGFGESAQAMSQAINANALAGQDAANQAAILAAQEDQAWRQRQGANYGAAAQLGLGAASQYGDQAQFQANLQQQQTNANAQHYLQAMSLATDQTQSSAAIGLQGLAQQGQLTQAAADTYLQGLVQAGQLTQQAADNLMRGVQTAGGFAAQGAEMDLGAQQAAGDLALQGAMGGAGVIQSGYGQALDAAQGAADLNLQGALGGAGVTQAGYDQGLAAIQGGISAGQAGAGLTGDLYGQGTQTQLQGNQIGLQAIDSFLASGQLEQAGYQTADQLLNSAMGGQVMANEQNQAALQLALDQYNQAVANEQSWEQLGLTQEQAETERQSNYFELIGALANAVGEAIPG